MSSPRRLHLWWLPPLLAALAVAIVLAVTLLLQGSKAGTPESLMLAWVLTFVVVLPVALLVLPLAGRIADAVRRHRRIVPFVGDKIPGLGQ